MVFAKQWNVVVIALAISFGLFLVLPSPTHASSVTRHPIVKTLPQDPLAAYWQATMSRLHPQASNCSEVEVHYNSTTVTNGYKVFVALWVAFQVDPPYNYCGYVYSSSYVNAYCTCASGTITSEVAIKNGGLTGGINPQPVGPGISPISYSANVFAKVGTAIDGAGVLNVGPHYIAYSGSSNGQPGWYTIPARNG